MITIFDLRSRQDKGLVDAIQGLFDTPVSVLKFSDQSISACIGCWNCWLKTPGQCVMQDQMTEHYSNYVNSDKVVLVLDTAQGFIDHKAKAFLDRTIPHYHPYIEIINQECHHVARYDRYPEMYFCFDQEGLTQAEEKVIEDYLARTAFHFKSDAYRIKFGESLSIEPLKHVRAHRLQVRESAAGPMEKLIVYNGSPRRTGSNSALILDKVKESIGDKVEIRDLKQGSNWENWAKSFQSDENVLFFLPLYVHAMPSHVMAFLEKLSPSAGFMGFFIQSGFPESSQSHYLEAYFEQLATRLGRKYLGTAIKGGVEGMQSRSEKMQMRLVQEICRLLKYLVNEGCMEKAVVDRLAMPVRFGRVISKGIQLFGEKSINSFWDRQLAANGAYDKRFDRPFSSWN